MASAELFASVVVGAVESVVSGSTKPAQGAKSEPQKREGLAGGPLPDSILANREPYYQGEWRKQPYVPRCSAA